MWVDINIKRLSMKWRVNVKWFYLLLYSIALRTCWFSSLKTTILPSWNILECLLRCFHVFLLLLIFVPRETMTVFLCKLYRVELVRNKPSCFLVDTLNQTEIKYIFFTQPIALTSGFRCRTSGNVEDCNVFFSFLTIHTILSKMSRFW